MLNTEVAAAFWELADLLELAGENKFKVIAYRRAAQRIESLDRPVEELAAQGLLKGIDGVGDAIAAKIRDLLACGTFRALDEARRKVDPGLVKLLGIPGVGPHTIRIVNQHLGVRTVDELEQAALEQRIRGLPGLGVKTEANILRGIQFMRSNAERVPLGIALPTGTGLLERLLGLAGVAAGSLAGGLRRMCTAVRDIDIVLASDDPGAVATAIGPMGEDPGVDGLPGGATADGTGTAERYGRPGGEDGCGWRRLSLALAGGLTADITIVRPRHYAVVLLAATGCRGHVERLTALARRAGIPLPRFPGDEGWEEAGARGFGSEEEIYRALGLAWIAPEMREDRGEVEAAAAGRLPQLIGGRDIRGDLHIHTNASDGTGSIEAMRSAGRELGYDYVAVCDHSRSLTIARGLSEERLLAQASAIRGMADGASPRVLAGIEVDILKDGSLDLSPEVLDSMDVVVASVHSAMRQDRETMTRRVLAAVRSPCVDIIGHPTGRLLGRRSSFDIDVGALLSEARVTDTALEVNAYPDRLDLSDEDCRRAREMGVKLCINTDAHAPDQMGLMTYGVAVARRAWLEPDNVINTWPLARLTDWLRNHKAAGRT